MHIISLLTTLKLQNLLGMTDVLGVSRQPLQRQAVQPASSYSLWLDGAPSTLWCSGQHIIKDHLKEISVCTVWKPSVDILGYV